MRKFLKCVKGTKRIDKVLKIGIIGAGRAVGTTYLSMMMANYCANFRGLKTALVECNDNKDYMRICNETSNIEKDIYDFSYKNIQFISAVTSKKISELEFKGYHVIILDCSMDTDFSFIEFSRCNVRIVVCSTELYKIGYTKKLLSDVKDIPIKAVAFCADKKAKAKLEKYFKRTINDIPIECNSLYITPNTCNWITQLLE